MKLLSYSVLMLVVANLIACSAKKKEEASTDPTPVVDSVITVSSKTATAFTVTWNAATDDATAAADLQYKLVYSTSNNLTTAADAEANGTVALAYTANTLTANLSSLTHSTTYYLAVLVKDADGNIALEGTSTITLCSGKRMFLATVSNGSFGGKAGADAACVAQRPGGTGTYKAVIADGTNTNHTTGQPAGGGRQACYGNCESVNTYVIDWTLAANTTYCTSDYATKVGATGVTRPVLYVSTASVLSTTAVNLFTGFNIAWGNSYASNCSEWTSTSGTYVGGISSGLYTGQSGSRDFISTYPFPDCGDPGAVICAEQ
jgi:hypothetical protein